MLATKIESVENRFLDDLHDSLYRKIVIMDKQECLFVKVDEIISAQADGSYTHISLTGNRKITVSKNIKTLEDKLCYTEFYRPHKSYLINLKFVQKYIKSEGGIIVLENGENILLSRRRKELFIKMLEQLSI